MAAMEGAEGGSKAEVMAAVEVVGLGVMVDDFDAVQREVQWEFVAGNEGQAALNKRR